ncbi:MAG: hypothetical protein V4649_11150 [Bacteroidota bacterium]
MKRPPYTHAEAAQLCADFQHLTGEPYSCSNNAAIECVAVVPFDELNKQKFIVYYHLLNDPVLALTHEYKGLLFDVLVLATYEDKCDLLHASLHSWVGSMACGDIAAQ